jgi:hypothetical protein
MLLLVIACSRTPPAESDPLDETAAPVDDSTAKDHSVLDGHVAAIVGSWSGVADPTPIGDIPFAIAFATDADRVAGTTTQLGFSFTFAFEPDEQHGIRFSETGSFQGFEQSHVLIPAEIASERVHWVDLEKPDVLTVTTEVDEKRLVMDAWVRGKRHATLVLDRQ